MSNTTAYTGTSETEQVIGAAQTKLALSLKQYEAAQQQLQKLPEILSDYTLRISAAEGQLNKLTIDIEEKKRQFGVELELKKKEDIAKIVSEYLNSRGETAVKKVDHAKLQDDLANALRDQEAVISKEVGKAVGMADNRHKAAIEIREADYRAKEAENRAQITSLTNQVNTLTKEIESWKKQLDDERKASIERAKAGSVGSINVSAPGK